VDSGCCAAFSLQPISTSRAARKISKLYFIGMTDHELIRLSSVNDMNL